VTPRRIAPPLREFSAGTLPGILEPFLWLMTADVKEIHGLESSFRLSRVQGWVKGPETVGDTGADVGALVGRSHQGFIDGLGRASREADYRAAEDAIAAAAAAGYRLAGSEISVRVRVDTDRETGIEVPCAECRVDLSFLVPAGREA
jgi:hypothetical protein